MTKPDREYNLSIGLQEQCIAWFEKYLKARTDELVNNVADGTILESDLKVLEAWGLVSSHKDPRLTLAVDE